MSDEEKFKRENTLLRAKVRGQRISRTEEPFPSPLPSPTPLYESSGMPVQNEADRSLDRIVRRNKRIGEFNG